MAQEHSPFIVLSPQPEFFPQGGVLAQRLETLRGKTIAFLAPFKFQLTVLRKPLVVVGWCLHHES